MDHINGGQKLNEIFIQCKVMGSLLLVSTLLHTGQSMKFFTVFFFLDNQVH